MTGGPEAALWGFLIFYVTCVFVTWWFYTRRGGLLHDIERGGPPPLPNLLSNRTQRRPPLSAERSPEDHVT